MAGAEQVAADGERYAVWTRGEGRTEGISYSVKKRWKDGRVEGWKMVNQLKKQ